MKRSEAIAAFDTYVDQFDRDNPMIYQKAVHSHKVAEIAERIARSLGQEELVDFAWLLGLLSLAGLWRLWKTREHSTALLAPLYCVGLTLAQMLAEVSDRYHYSLLPMLVLLAAVSGRTMKGERT